MKKKIAMVLVVVLGMSLIGCSEPEKANMSARALVSAQYPDRPVYPQESDFEAEDDYVKALDKYVAWSEERRNDEGQLDVYAEHMRLYFDKAIPEFLTDTKGENLVFSPLNVYMALAMLAETTEGSSRQQILDLLGADDIEELREHAKLIGELNYYSNDYAVNVLANSLWLSNDTGYRQETLDLLKYNYYADVFQGVMGSDDYNQMLQDWMQEKTGDLLSDRAKNVSFDQDTTLGLASTVQFKAKWDHPFQKENTAKGIFHAAGGDVDAEFMAQELEETYCRGEKFKAVNMTLAGDSQMWLLLPDEGVTPEQLLEDKEAVQFLYGSRDWKDSERMKIHLKVPRFDIQSSTDLQEGLQNLGIMDVFHEESADFKALTDSDVFLSSAKQATRMMIDEEGVAAAAFTTVETEIAGEPAEEEMDFVVDRPFVCMITTGFSAFPLFVAVVHMPV